MSENMPSSLVEAMLAEPLWLQLWVMLLVVVHLAALPFALTRDDSGTRRPRYQALAIIVSFLLAGAFMNWLYAQVGYVRLLGLAHLIFWLPVYVWVWRTRDRESGTLYARYLIVYLVIAGISLLIDAVDVIRYLLGDGALL